MRHVLSVAFISAALVLCAREAPSQTASPALPPGVPTIDQILSLKRAGSPEISPDGRLVAYTVREANWDDNAYETEIWLADVTTGSVRQLTNGKNSSSAPSWSPDGKKLAFISDRSDKRQIYVINPAGGEAEALTSLDEGVRAFAWAPDGTRIAFTATEPKSAALKDREKKYGEFEIVDHDRRMTHLYVLDVTSRATKQLTTGPFTVGSFSWSPDGRAIAFDHRIDDDPANGGTANISIVTVADGRVRPLVTQDGPDSHPVWSPDGTRIAFETAMANPAFYYTNSLIATIAAAGGPIDVLTPAFDEDPSLVAWRPAGIYFAASRRTSSLLYRVDPATKSATGIGPSPESVNTSFSLTPDGKSVAYLGADANSIAEVYVASGFDRTLEGAKKLTDLNQQTAAFPTRSTLEVVSWKSQDGTPIEGVLHKPAGFDPRHKYPLLVVIHGGPTGTSRAIPFASAIYPIDIWVPRGALVLEPNYRGSAGYGQKFRSLNVRNLGVGDAWDVLSGIDALVAKGIVDAARVGVMGWSQGGYISAFLATHDSARFKAVSVGAGISDWMTYYVNTDIHPFTRQYLKATPWDDPAIYAKTSPITYIKQAKTPVLIQHGDADHRVPPPNAFELYQGLEDNHVPVKLIVYKEFGGLGHGPSKPKSFRAVMEHNLEWFDQYLFQGQTPRPTSQR